VSWSMSFAPLVPLWIIAVLGAVALVMVGLGILTRARGTPLRALALTALVLALLNPAVREEDREPLSDIAVLVVDRSQSQELADRMDLVAEAEAQAREALGRLPHTEFRVATVTSGITSGEDGTHLFAALRRALADVPPERYAGAVMITDGQVHDVPDAIAELGYDGPLHALITGRQGERDRRLVVENAPRFAIVGQQHRARITVQDAGLDGSRIATVTVTVDGAQPQTFEAVTGDSLEIPIDVRHGGKNVIEISVDPLPGEISLENNRAVIVTEGIRDRLRVLLVSGEPHPGERTWRNLLKADASVDLVHFTILRPPEKQDGTPIRELSLIAFPTRELFVEKLDQFDLIVFDRYQRRGVLPLAYLANVVDYVNNGGAVLIAAGPDYASPLSLYRTPLAEILPAVPTGNIVAEPFHPRITDAGRRHPVTSALAADYLDQDGEPRWGRWFRLIDAQVRDGATVMDGPGGKPLMLLTRQQEGRVALLLSDQAWLWTRGYEGGGPQSELLRRFAHWLMKEPELEEEALSGRQVEGQLVVERRTMSEESAPVTVTGPSGVERTVELQEVTPGLFQARLDVSEAGIHRLDDGNLSSVAAVGSADSLEILDLHATAEKLQPVVQGSRGGIAWLAGSGDDNAVNVPQLVKVKPGRAMAGPGWLGLQSTGAYTVRAIEELPLFGLLLTLALLLGLLVATWYREGH
jgi:hypothetical protein